MVRPACLIFPRYRWLAMDPLTEPKTMPEPVEFVVIGKIVELKINVNGFYMFVLFYF